MGALRLPKSVAIQLSLDGEPAAEVIALGIHLFFANGIDLDLGPFVTDEHGQLALSRATLQASITAAYRWDGVRYPPLETAFSFVELRLWRHYDWSCALQRRKRWPRRPTTQGVRHHNLDEFKAELRRWNNVYYHDPDPNHVRIRDEWRSVSAAKKYVFPIYRNKA